MPDHITLHAPATPVAPLSAPMGLLAFYCEAEEDYHNARRDPSTGMCPACAAPPERL